MRIAHLISSGGLFGAENILLSLGEYFNQNGDQTFIGALHDKREPHIEIIKRAKEQELPVFEIESRGRFDFVAIFRLRRFLKQNKINLLHTHNYKSNLIGLLAVWFTGIPIVATAHGYTEVTRAVSVYEIIDRFLLKHFFDHVVLVTRSVVSGVPQSRRSIVHNGINLENFSRTADVRSEIRTKYNIKKNDLVIGTVGRLSREKNQAFLLDAAESIVRKFRDAKFLVVGSGPEEDALKLSIRKRGLERQVIFTGLLKNVAPIYQAMDIFALTSKTEGIPVAMLEAMASKRPIIATRVGGIPNVIKENRTGMLVRSGDRSDLIQNLEFLIMNKRKREQLAESAYDFLKEQYSGQRMYEDYKKVYEKVVK